MQNKLVTTNRWWVYQRDRFPIFAHSPLLLAFSFSAVSYSSLLRGDLAWPAFKSIVTAFITSLLFFLQLSALNPNEQNYLKFEMDGSTGNINRLHLERPLGMPHWGRPHPAGETLASNYLR